MPLSASLKRITMVKVDPALPPEGIEPGFPWKYLFKEVGPRTAAKKRRDGVCKHWGCKHQTRRPTARDCHTCASRKVRIKNPQRYAFTQVKRSADMRHIPFNLTFEQFLDFDRQTDYVKSKGMESDSLTIDRIDASKGYEVGNIRALTWADNCAKRINGMTDPAEPIAKAMCLAAGGDNWYKYKKQAVDILYQVELLQAQVEGGFEPVKDINPF